LRKAQNENGDQWSGSVADHVTVELHNASNYSMTEYTASNVDLNTDGTISLTIPGSLGGSYYITIRHRNSIETTTSNPVSFSTPTVSYQFDASSIAFGDNMKLVNGNYCIYGGDVNQDGIVDSSDMIPIDNLSSNFATGYISEDANGDGLVDSGDMIIVDNNSSNFVGAMTP
jgi:hypothetical protein